MQLEQVKVQLDLLKAQSRPGFLMLPYPLTNFEIQKYQNELKFNGVYSRNNLLKIKNKAYVINLGDYESQ